MAGNLFIVESPHKAGQIQGFLGKEDFKVVSSKGHIRDLEEKGMSIDIANGFVPKYVISSDKKALVAELKKLAAGADMVWLASDPDREGEAIAWHLAQTLGLDPAKTRRITYNEITKDAVLKALQEPRAIDMNLVDAQQARRVLDRLVGFELSPVLWRKIRRGLSAGRVQSVTLRLVVEREREIAAFRSEPYYSVTGAFLIDGQKASGTLEKKFSGLEEARRFLEDNIGAAFRISDIERKEGTRNPAPPFTTSTLQQEAARKLHFTSSRTMRIAQSLYEKGLITYMRTDSTNLSGLALSTAKQFILDNFGPEYSHLRNFKTRSKGAQEAHEAIRPTFISNTAITGTPDEQRLYDLIWKRTVASQMSEAKVLLTTVRIASSNRPEQFVIPSTEVLFDGFLKLYSEGSDDAAKDGENVILRSLSADSKVECKGIDASCKFTQAPWRYSEQTLIKKMEEIGIGRPSTYAPTITTLTSGRGYIVTSDKEGTKIPVTNLSLRGSSISEIGKTEVVGAEKRKLIPSDVGIMVTDYLMENFPDIMDYDFTASVEGDFDEIAEGRKVWNDVIGKFYQPFHGKVESAITNTDFSRIEREIGIDPADGRMITARFGQFGPYVQKGEGPDRVFASLAKGQLIETITLEEAASLFKLPRTVGEYEGIPVIATKGRFGPYLKYGERNITIPRGSDPMKITLEECVKLISAEPAAAAAPAVLKEFGPIQVLNGRYGPYIKYDGKNYKIPSGTAPETLTEESCRGIIAAGPAPAAKKFRRFTKKK